MGTPHTVKLKNYNYDKHETEDVGEVSIYTLSRSMDVYEMGALLEGWINCDFREYREGLAIGKLAHSMHRTLQASLFRFCIGVITGISQQEYTDARNEIAVETSKKIAKMFEDGDLKLGYMI